MLQIHRNSEPSSSKIGTDFYKFQVASINNNIRGGAGPTQSEPTISENVIKILSDFGAIFWKKAWAIVQGNFQNLAHF